MFIDDGVRACVGPWRGFKFQLVEGLKIEFLGIFKQKEQFDPNFFESCVDFEVAHFTILMVWRLP